MAVGITINDDSTLHLPRILCLHGGGTNATIFRAQCRVVEAALRPTFRLCYAQAPFPSQAGPDVLMVYREYGPFRAWLRAQPGGDAKDVIERIEESLGKAMAEDDLKGATGEWVAVLGFSQGAKMCASLLFSQQLRAERLHEHNTRSNFRFGVIMAGRGPLVSMAPQLDTVPGLVDASRASSLNPFDDQNWPDLEDLLRIPTIHVHGLQDPGLDLHRKLLHQYFDEDTTRLIEWDGDHRIPIKSKDVGMLVQEIRSVAKETGVL